MGEFLGILQVACGIMLLLKRDFRKLQMLWMPLMFLTLGAQAITESIAPQRYVLLTVLKLAMLACVLSGWVITRKPTLPRDKKRFALRIVGLAIVLTGGAVAAVAPQQDPRGAFMWIGGVAVLVGAALWLFARERSPRPDLP